MVMADPFDPSRTQRLVLLLDLHPVLSNPNPDHPYLSSLVSASRCLLSIPSPPADSSLLCTYKPFFSSLSPILSSSLSRLFLRKPLPSHLSFDLPTQTLQHLSETLSAISPISHPDAIDGSPPRGSMLARSLLQLEHDYGWETPAEHNPRGKRDFVGFRSNLVVVFSKFPKTVDGLLEFLDLDAGSGDKLPTWECFWKVFHRTFGLVNERLASKEIHLTWVDVTSEAEFEEENVGLGFLQRGVRKLGWGFCSIDSIVLGSAVVPSGLVLPYVGCSMGFTPSGSAKRGCVELVLGIADVDGDPIECKICDLEMLDMNLSRDGLDSCDLLSGTNSSSGVKIVVKEVWMENKVEKVAGNHCAIILLCGTSAKRRHDAAVHSMEELLIDKVLQSFSTEKDELLEPVWQLLLAFLFRGRYQALVSITDGSGSSFDGILRPFMVNYALLYIVDKNFVNSCQLAIERGIDSSEFRTNDSRRKRNKNSNSLLQDTRWITFREAVYNRFESFASEFNLEDIYLIREHAKSKKLRFLKCWMKQMKRSKGRFRAWAVKQEEPRHGKRESEERDEGSMFEPQLNPFSSTAAGGSHLHEKMSKEASLFPCVEGVEAFFESIPKKIEHGFCSEESDLGILAERLVGLCIHALFIKYGRTKKEHSVPNEDEDTSNAKVVAELSHCLLRKPKELALKYKGCNAASCASDRVSPLLSTENKVREHELQILFRMEILRSSIGAGVEENSKQRITKEICSLLQNIEFDLQKNDLFHGASLVDFAERTIKSRYSHSLGDVIHKIYTQMEFFSFDDDSVEASESLPNSNDESQRDKDGNPSNPVDDIALNVRASSYQTSSKAGISLYHQDTGARSHQERKTKIHEQRVVKAQERRDRDRKFSSFTTWMPDLQRVWAPKQPRAEKLTQDPLPKPSKRRKGRSRTHDMVCETPLTERKQSLSGETEEMIENCDCSGNNSRRSLSKALFQGEGDFDSAMAI